MKSRIKRHGDCIEIKLVNSTSTGEQLHHETIYDLFDVDSWDLFDVPDSIELDYDNLPDII